MEYAMNDNRDPNCAISCFYHVLNTGSPITKKMLENIFRMILLDPMVKERDAQLGAFLSGLMVRGTTAEEVELLIRTALNIDGLLRFRPTTPHGERIVCVAGSGKKGLKTFNISTPSCIVAAATGAYIAKPGSRATSSITGAIDFGSVVGARQLSPQDMSEVLIHVGFGLFSIENLIPKFDSVYGGKTFGPTPLSFGLPAIVNPIVCDAVYYGLSHPSISLALEVLGRFGYKTIIAVTSSPDSAHYIDELSPLKINIMGRVTEGVAGGIEQIDTSLITGVPSCKGSDLKPAGSLLENIQLSVCALAGRSTGAHENVIALNAAGILLCSGKEQTLDAAFRVALDAIKSGAALEKLKEFVIATGGNTNSINTLLA
jgi:anthranilate phosphoribosyltransferase